MGYTLTCVNHDEKILVKVVGIRGNKVRIGISAPDNVSVWRDEVFAKIEKARAAKATKKR